MCTQTRHKAASSESNTSLCNMLAAAEIPAPLLIFTAKSHDSRGADSWSGGGGCRLTVKVLEKKKNVGRSQRERRRRKKKKKWNWTRSILRTVEQQQETVVTKTNPVPQLSLEMKRITGNKQQLSKFYPHHSRLASDHLDLHQMIPSVPPARPRRLRVLLAPFTVNIVKIGTSRQHKQKGFFVQPGWFGLDKQLQKI